MPLEERVREILKEEGITIPAHLQVQAKTTNEPEADQQRTVDETKAMHYDREDLVSFHELMISKALTKAASELEYDHPTVI